MLKEKLKETLFPFQKKIEESLSLYNGYFGEDNKLKECCLYALQNGGKRFRPALVLMMAESIGKRKNVLKSALAVEYFHTASLIADDLPCMDNDEMRRGKPSTHVVYGEATALLASYALIAAGYLAISENIKETVVEEGQGNLAALVLETASQSTGVLGATGGQYIDLFPDKIDVTTYFETVKKKTISLFELSMVFGWLFGGGEITSLPTVKKAAYHYGMAFQMFDDLDDIKIDSDLKREMNAVFLFGEEKTKELIKNEVFSYKNELKKLNIDKTLLFALADHF